MLGKDNRGRTPGLPISYQPSTNTMNAQLTATPIGGYGSQSNEPAYPDMGAEWDKWWSEYQQSLNSWLKQQLKSNRRDMEANRDHANVTKEINERVMRGMMGPDSGRGLSLIAGNNSNWINNIAQYRNTMQDANARARDAYNERRASAYERYMNAKSALGK